MSAEAIFIGANRQEHSADVDAAKDIVAFGAGNTVALWNTSTQNSKGVYYTLKGHTGEVTCVRFVQSTPFLVSGAEDSTVRVWKFSEDDETILNEYQVLTEHSESVIAINVFGSVVGTTDSTGKIVLWKLVEEKFIKIHEFSSKVGLLPLTIAIQEISADQYILAVGGSGFKILIYSFTLSGDNLENFEQVAELEGHEDWVKTMDFKELADGDFLLASGSQDRYIRLWRVRTNDLIDNSDEDETKLTLLSNKQYKFSILDTKVAINFEALIMGHDDWVSSIRWHSKELKLLASTSDTALLVWQPDEVSGIWICSSRLGEISQKGASTATGSSGGFWASLWYTDGLGKEHIMTNGRTGSWRHWISDDGEQWEQTIGVTGCIRKCTDVTWSISGEYLLGTSLDQTTRLYSKWAFNSDGSKRTGTDITWQEFARPQIHGYDMIAIATLSNSRFISGGDEKILRSFDEPKGVAELLNKFCGIKNDHVEIMPDSAALPVLGLSNKANNDREEQEQEQDHQLKETAETHNISYETLSSLELPPFEDHLQRHTLWPEIEKLYGHGYEIIAVDTSNDHQLIATTCRSNTQQHGVIRIFDSQTWLEVKPSLKLHNLTVTRVRFSPDDKYLLSVSRDRQFGLWSRDPATNEFTLVRCNEKAHSRIIWDCCWSPSEFGYYFITASRDKSVKLWEFNTETNSVELILSQKFDFPVTAVDIHKKVVNNEALLISIGLEDGSIEIFKFTKEKQLNSLTKISKELAPADRISRLSWSVCSEAEFLLAAASSDHSVRIYSFKSQICENS